MLHILDISHEHLRGDRDNYIYVYKSNIDPGINKYMKNFVVFITI